ncbi:MAG: hypothetical protein IIT49_06440 [Clostridia bacterium]|nr:hypothetical protein [Clostridia bacterium]
MFIDWKNIIGDDENNSGHISAGFDKDKLHPFTEEKDAEADFFNNTAPAKKQERSNCENGRYYLNVPYANKEMAKALGARWDPDKKKWYYTNPKDKDKFSQWS